MHLSRMWLLCWMLQLLQAMVPLCQHNNKLHHHWCWSILKFEIKWIWVQQHKVLFFMKFTVMIKIQQKINWYCFICKMYCCQNIINKHNNYQINCTLQTPCKQYIPCNKSWIIQFLDFANLDLSVNLICKNKFWFMIHAYNDVILLHIPFVLATMSSSLTFVSTQHKNFDCDGKFLSFLVDCREIIDLKWRLLIACNLILATYQSSACFYHGQCAPNQHHIITPFCSFSTTFNCITIWIQV